MKYLKMIGLAAIAVTALMALVGTGTASAQTTLCNENNLTSCYGVGQAVEGKSVTKATLTGAGGLFTIECDSTVSGSIETATTPSGNVAAENLKWSNCGESKSATTVTGGTMSIHAGEGGNGTVKMKNFVVKVVSGITCYYGGEVSGSFTGGSKPMIGITTNVTKNTVHPSNAFCPSTAVWHAEYEVTSPTPAFAVAGK